mgnify:CR=1 FL=1
MFDTANGGDRICSATQAAELPQNARRGQPGWVAHTAACGRNQRNASHVDRRGTDGGRSLRTTQAASYPGLGAIAANDRHPDLASIQGSSTRRKRCHLLVAGQWASSPGARVTRIVRLGVRTFSRITQISPA